MSICNYRKCIVIYVQQLGEIFLTLQPTHTNTHGVLSEETLNLLAFLKHVKNYKLFVTS